MKAIILAAGYGNRMRPLTDNRHKTMLEVGGKTIIGRIIDGLAENNISDIVVVTGYRDQELKEYLSGLYRNLHLTFVHNANYKETNNIYSMALAFESVKLDSDIILIESDLVYRPEVIGRLLRSEHGNIALVDKYRAGMDGTVVTVEDGMITNVIPPHLQSESFDFSDKYKTLNIYKFSREFCETSFKKLLVYYANAIDKNCYYELILGILIYMQKETIHAEIIDGEVWAEVDDPNDLQIAEFGFNARRREILGYAMGGYWNYDITDFCFIRNMHFPNAAIISEMKNVLPDLIHNYGSRQDILDRKLSWFLLCTRSRCTALNGSSQLYPLLRLRFGGSKALLPAPTFGEYARVFTNHATYGDAGTIDRQTVTEAASSCDIVVFVNPNNPTGTEMETGWIFEFARKHPGKTIIVDESFIEFSSYPSIVSLLETAPLENVIVIKSLSKSLGVPGIRLGYTYSCDARYTEFVTNNLPIWNLNSAAEFFLEIILKHRGALKRSFALTISDRSEFAALLKQVKIIEKVFDSGANFLLVRLNGDGAAADRLCSRLLSDKLIYVKDVSSRFPDGKGYLRLAVRTGAENRRLVECLNMMERAAAAGKPH
ncbi:MAG: aminotransferase class I/II-fold pyridoxal phosphate-dependent enzyme [Chitinispirillaceae bacterium]|nr:aminotransferase class I/II-fold pyridoxal phosphate-dependent enzyme [Chitinispirillaceae bacterium]